MKIEENPSLLGFMEISIRITCSSHLTHKNILLCETYEAFWFNKPVCINKDVTFYCAAARVCDKRIDNEI